MKFVRHGAAMKTRFAIAFIVSALSGLAFVTTVRADQEGDKPPSKAMLEKYDANHDGVISEEEKEAGKAAAKEAREARRQEELDKYDENKDGKINRDERAKIKADREAEKEAKKAKS
jgi:hypothetical protein